MTASRLNDDPADERRWVRIAVLVTLTLSTMTFLALQSVLRAAPVDVIGNVYIRCVYAMPERVSISGGSRILWRGAARWSQEGTGMCSTAIAATHLDAFTSYTISAGTASKIVERDHLLTINTWVLKS